MLLGEWLQRFQRFADQAVEPETGEADLLLAGFDAGQVEQLVDQAQQAVGVFLDASEIAARPLVHRAGDPVEKVVGRPHDRGEWGAQLVRHLGDEIGFEIGKLLQLLRRLVLALVRLGLQQRHAELGGDL